MLNAACLVADTATFLPTFGWVGWDFGYGVGLRVRGLRVGYGVCGSGSESGVGEGEALEDRDSSGETGEFIVVEIRDA